ncbi:hypothetical protein B0H11DRAFT_1955651 [Mycena galericulata]|nr:hypothetical protein B0H11DRAFT_1955651 [Mycena galericulata]
MNAASILDIFPQELIDRVIDESADSAATLRSCALVCKAFLPSSQAHIFLSIDCTITATSMAQNRFERLSQVLSISPHLARHIQSLRITCPFHDDMDAETDLAILYVPLTLVISLIPVLRSFDMTDSTRSVWTRLSARCKAAICNLCERSNLSKLHLQGIVALSVTEFSQLVSSPSLTELSLGSVTILPSTNGEMITGDNSKLDTLTLHESESTDIIMPWLVRGGRISQLRHLYGTWNLGRTPHLQGLIDESNASLRALVLVTYFGVSFHPLPGLSLASATSLCLLTLYFPSVFTNSHTYYNFPWF